MACSDPTVKSQCGKSVRTPNNLCCPSCGAVECLCRPRFFAGQLLSEQDLNRLDQYIKNKNRLHIRNLHGWGVVNGLKVLCDPCGAVKVTEGYAVNPCGDDIVVCAETAVDICALIRQCKQTRMNYDCKAPSYQPRPNSSSSNQPGHNPESHCEDLEEEWVLAIQYEEWPSRGVTPLRGNGCNTRQCAPGAAPTSGCSCGGGKSCGCTGKSSTAKQPAQTARMPRGASSECEATLICESFSFDAYRKPVRDTNDEDDDNRLWDFSGSFAEAFNCCAGALIATMPPMPNLQDDDNMLIFGNAISKWCCSWRKNLIDYFLTHPNTSCEVIEFLQKVDCPSPARPNSFVIDFYIAFFSLLAAWAEGLKVCLCLSLLPPTPAASCDLRVPLASLRIRSRDCKVLSICNWTTERKMLLTWPAISHWLGIFSIGSFFRELLDTICCNSLLDIFAQITERLTTAETVTPGATANPNEMAGFGVNTATADFSNAAHNKETPGFAQVLTQMSGALAGQLTLGGINRNSANFDDFIGASLARGSEPLELGALLNSVSPRFKLPDNDQPLSDIEAKNIPLLLLGEMVVKPVATSILGERETKLQMRQLRKQLRGAPPAATEAGNHMPLQTRLQELQQQLDEQAKALAEVKLQLKHQ